MNRTFAAAVALLVLLQVTPRVHADIITFGTQNVDQLSLAGQFVQGNFAYQATAGIDWELQTTYANGGAALATFFNGTPSQVGNTVVFTRVGGGLFTFDFVDYATRDIASSDNLQFTGYLNGNPVGTLNLTFETASPNAFQTIPSGFGGPIDSLQLQVTSAHLNAAFVDNLVLTPLNASTVIPEPTTLALTLLGGAIGWVGFRRSTRRGNV